MQKIIILTATYNHGDILDDLYNSLLQQDDRDFLWIVINDGSTDNTAEVLADYQAQKKLDLLCVTKENGGKSSAINCGLGMIPEDAMVTIIDDDETLDTNAVSIMRKYYTEYYGSQIGLLHFNRRNKETGKVIANFDMDQDMKMDIWSFKKNGYHVDGYVAYFGHAIKELHFPIYPGEKYVGPSVMQMMCNQKYDALWVKDSIGMSDYLEGGITKQGRRLRIKNPMGMIKYCVLMQDRRAGVKLRMKYSVSAYAYMYIGKLKTVDVKKQINLSCLYPFTALPGRILGMIWKKKS